MHIGGGWRNFLRFLLDPSAAGHGMGATGDLRLVAWAGLGDPNRPRPSRHRQRRRGFRHRRRRRLR